MSAVDNFRKHLNEMYLKSGGRDGSFVTDLAKRIGVTRKVIHDYMAGAEPKLGTLAAIAKELGLSIDELVGAKKPEYAAPRPANETEMAGFVLKKLGLSGPRLELALFALEGEEMDIDVVLKEFPAFTYAAGRKSSKRGSS